MDVFGARLHTPQSEGIGRQTRFKPFREILWRSEVVTVRERKKILVVRSRVGHGGDFEKTTGFQRERKNGASG